LDTPSYVRTYMLACICTRADTHDYLRRALSRDVLGVVSKTEVVTFMYLLLQVQNFLFSTN